MSKGSAPHARPTRARRRGGGGAPSGRRRTPDLARTIALEALTSVHRDEAFANLVLPPLLDAAHLGRRDAGFATALAYGTLRLQGRYDAILSLCVDRDLEALDPVVLDVLRLGAHQLLGMRVATHGAVSATVDLATSSAGRGAAGLVNAVLRKVASKDLDHWLATVEKRSPDPVTAASRLYSHPAWIVEAFRQALLVSGRPETELEALLEADNDDPRVMLCARPGLVTAGELTRQARAASGQEPRQGHLSPYAVELAGGDPGRIPSVRSAAAAVEDEGSQLTALLAAEPPLEGRDEYWLDLCAGPGGKAALMAARAAQRGAHLVANEIAPHRCDLVRSSCAAVPADVVEVRCADGRTYGTTEPASYDRVLVDAPCTGLGSLRRRPEARWRRRPQDVTELAALQRELLASAIAAVRPGGLVTYVTCSPHALETSLAVTDAQRAASRRGLRTELCDAGALATTIAPHSPAGADRQLLQLWPHLDQTDAMFCAIIRRLS